LYLIPTTITNLQKVIKYMRKYWKSNEYSNAVTRYMYILYFLSFSFDDLTKIVYRNRSWYGFSINEIRTHDREYISLTTRPGFRPYYFYSTDWISDSRKRLFDFRRDAARGAVRWSSPPRQNWLRNHDFCRQTILKVKYHP